MPGEGLEPPCPRRTAGFKPAAYTRFRHPGGCLAESEATLWPAQPSGAPAVGSGRVPSFRVEASCSQTRRRRRPPRADTAAAAAVRRAPGRADATRQPGRLRGARGPLPVAPAGLLPPHARVARGRRGRPAGGLRRRLQRDDRRRARAQRAPVAVPHRAQPLAQPPAPHAGDRRGLDGRPPRPRTAARRPTRSTAARSSASWSSDVQELPETQRTALLLREIDALSYEQIAEAMETTIPTVKSLLVRARVSLAEAAEARAADLRGGAHRARRGRRGAACARARRSAGTCARASAAPTFRKQLRQTNKALAAVFPVGPLLLLKKLVLANLGTTASAGGSAAAAGAGASAARRGRRWRAVGGPGRRGLEGGRRPGRRRDRHRRRRRGRPRRPAPARRPPRPGRRRGQRRRPTTPQVIAAAAAAGRRVRAAAPAPRVAKTQDKARTGAADADKVAKAAARADQRTPTAQQRATDDPGAGSCAGARRAPQQASATATMPSPAPGTVAPSGGTTAPDEQPTPPPTTTATAPPRRPADDHPPTPAADADAASGRPAAGRDDARAAAPGDDGPAAVGRLLRRPTGSADAVAERRVLLGREQEHAPRRCRCRAPGTPSARGRSAWAGS